MNLRAIMSIGIVLIATHVTESLCALRGSALTRRGMRASSPLTPPRVSTHVPLPRPTMGGHTPARSFHYRGHPVHEKVLFGLIWGAGGSLATGFALGGVGATIDTILKDRSNKDKYSNLGMDVGVILGGLGASAAASGPVGVASWGAMLVGSHGWITKK